ncbi:hypothetical protein FNO01nite_32610 [Flavobacterium noncentrifugens]|uniref:Uncharacterized protein n=1 Tax=Flavobacterium noncentrifugens TaxID=1128970 RepID=A0A1G8UTD2_9FLAO|nr:hypothetical protein [Flavobacterium noncentrifugens]GEP52589.1 hypothetical protein FNO01nite_32610 [Flavobacterium noncentrifugens]SDJ56924.1 hypothetical protein SAMN04487935_1035 [Flavobacterium noncentrifugens]
MARQMGLIKLKGTIGGMTFYKTSTDGHLVREKGGIDKNRILSDPAFQRTRENGSEFGRAGKAGKMLRTTLRALLLNSADGRMTSRLHKAMVKVIQADVTNERGLRNVIDGEAELLLGFEFNIKGKLGTTLFAPYVAAIDRVTGEITVDIAPFIPTNMITAPSGTTHYKIISSGAEIDFENEVFTVATSETAILPWDAALTVAVAQTNQVTAASTKPLFLALGIEFFQEVNGSMYSLKNGAFNPLSLVKVSGL